MKFKKVFLPIMIVAVLLIALLPIAVVGASSPPPISTQNVQIEFGAGEWTGNFKALNLTQFRNWLKYYDTTDQNEYSYPDYMCADFARDLRDNFYNDYGFYGVFFVTCHATSGTHHMNAALVQTNPYLDSSWIFIEPQNDDYWRGNNLPDSGWHQYSYLVDFPGSPTGIFPRMYLCYQDAEPLFVAHGITCCFDPWDYDVDNSGAIEKDEAVAAINDYYDHLITKAWATQVISLYFG